MAGAAWFPAAQAPCASRVVIDVRIADPDDAWIAIAVQELALDFASTDRPSPRAGDEADGCTVYRQAQMPGATSPWRLVHERPDGSRESLHSEHLPDLVAAVVSRGRPLAVPAAGSTGGAQRQSSAALAADLLRSGSQALQQDHLALASQRLRRAVRLSRQDGDWPATATALLLLARASGLGGQRAVQQVQWDTARRIASRRGLREAALDAQLLQAEMRLAEGDVDAAAALGRASLLAAQLRASPRLERDAHAVLGQALLAGGRFGEAESVLRAALMADEQDPAQRLRSACALQQSLARQSKWRDAKGIEATWMQADDEQLALERSYCSAQLAHMSGEHDAAESGWLLVARQASAQGRESLLRRSATALGALALQRGDARTAESWLGLALTGGGEDAAVRTLLEQYRDLPRIRRTVPWPAPGTGILPPAPSKPP